MILLIQEGYERGCSHKPGETADSGEVFECWQRHFETEEYGLLALSI